MGYTHGWNHPRIEADVWAALVADAKRVIEAADIEVFGGDGTGKPEFGKYSFAINGSFALGEDYETFELTRTGTSFAFCKTNMRPYDVVVTAILLRATLTVPGFTLKSDGQWGRDWSAGRELYVKAFSDSPDKPSGLRD